MQGHICVGMIQLTVLGMVDRKSRFLVNNREGKLTKRSRRGMKRLFLAWGDEGQ